MKIAVIDTTIDGELIGGAQTFLPKLLKGLIAENHEVHLIAKGAPNAKVRRQVEETGVTLHTNLWNKDGFVEETAPVLARWLNALNPDIYLISVSPDIGWVALPLLSPNIATLGVGHTDSETFYLPARHYRQFLTRAVGVSPEVCVSYVLSCVIEKERVEWIPYGVEASETAPAESGDNVLKLIYVGRLEEEQKRVSDLVKVARALSEKGVNYNLQIVGDGEELPRVHESLSAEIAAGKVVLRGWLDGTEVIEAMRAAEIFVLTSAYEGFCIALTEAMANGCCAVATDITSGNSELIETGANGYLVPVGGTDEFAEKLKFLSENRETLLAMRKAAWEKGKNYGIAKMVENYENCFAQAIEDAQNAPRANYADFPLMETCRSRFPLWLRRLKKRRVSAG
ncbi:MAG TPA: glycosyltransferase family 4 protein [Pyrinomonadaceae bacterium]|jgi:glycosyltransferase involved in cell wall biosynthesis